MFKGYHHIGLYVQDMEKSLKFYQEGLGGKITMSFGPEDHKIYMVELAPGAVVELIPHETSGANMPWAHIALWTDEIHAAFDRAVAAGAKIKSAPRDEDGPMNNAFIIGPDDESIEFFQTK